MKKATAVVLLFAIIIQMCAAPSWAFAGAEPPEAVGAGTAAGGGTGETAPDEAASEPPGKVLVKYKPGRRSLSAETIGRLADATGGRHESQRPTGSVSARSNIPETGRLPT